MVSILNECEQHCDVIVRESLYVVEDILCVVLARDVPLKPEGKRAHTTVTVFLTYFGSVLPVRNTVTIQCFDAVGWAT